MKFKRFREEFKKLLDIAKIGIVSVAAVGITFFGIKPMPARADLQTSLEKINLTMTALEGISETGVGIVVVPFGIGFALKIAGHVLRAGT